MEFIRQSHDPQIDDLHASYSSQFSVAVNIFTITIEQQYQTKFHLV
jgi:hypothetical protein